MVDSDAASREAVAEAFASLGYTVEQVGSAGEALATVRRKTVTLLLTEVVLPDMSGLELLRRIREDPTNATLPVIFMSSRADEIDRVIGFELGADDYVVKPFSARELVLRGEAVLKRTAPANTIRSDALRVGPLAIDVSGHEVRLNGRPVTLQRRELALLVELAATPGRVQQRDDLLRRVCRPDTGGDSRAIDTLVARLRRHLGEYGSRIETVRGVGYRLRTD